MTTFLLVSHHSRTEAIERARGLAEWLTERNHRVVVLPEDARSAGLTQWEIPFEELEHAQVECAVSLGGDGTMLRAIDAVCQWGVPVLGVNFGQLAYLAEVEPEAIEDSIQRFLDGEYYVEKRMTLDVKVSSASSGSTTSSTLSLARRIAINEVVVEKPPMGTTVRLGVEIDDIPFLSYAVDGMIVATPTGSTAYNLSARGPILSPSLNAMLITPVSPHMLFDRSMVLAPEESVTIRVIGQRDAAVVVDGQHVATIAAGGVVSCRPSQSPARLIVFSKRDFRRVLKAKFGLADR